VGGDGAFAEDHPGVAAAGEVDDGGGDGAGGGAAVDDEGDLVAELLATQSAQVHSGMPRRLAEVAVMGRPRPATTARAMAASGTRRATLPVLAVTRRGRRAPALTTMVSGPGQKRSARRSKAVSMSRARP
jgi:hypothetical protein